MMDKSVLMLLFLGCFPLVIFQARSLQCRYYDEYINGRSAMKFETCNTKKGEVCSHYRDFDINNTSHIYFGYSDCSQVCSPYYSRYGQRAHLGFCCDYPDLCNDMPELFEYYVKKLSLIQHN